MYAVFPGRKLRVNLLSLPALLLTVRLEGLLPAVLLFTAALLHEAGHFAAMRAFGVPVMRMDIEPMGALIAYDDSFCPLSASAWIAFSGAGANLLTMLLCLPFASSVYVLFFALANGFLALLNLLPWEKLDGGKLLLCILLSRFSPDRSERICRVCSRVSLFGMALFLLAVGLHSSFPLWHLLLSAVLLAQTFR